jgi:hypothetical protein
MGTPRFTIFEIDAVVGQVPERQAIPVRHIAVGQDKQLKSPPDQSPSGKQLLSPLANSPSDTQLKSLLEMKLRSLSAKSPSDKHLKQP